MLLLANAVGEVRLGYNWYPCTTRLLMGCARSALTGLLSKY